METPGNDELLTSKRALVGDGLLVPRSSAGGYMTLAFVLHIVQTFRRGFNFNFITVGSAWASSHLITQFLNGIHPLTFLVHGLIAVNAGWESMCTASCMLHLTETFSVELAVAACI